MLRKINWIQFATLTCVVWGTCLLLSSYAALPKIIYDSGATKYKPDMEWVVNQIGSRFGHTLKASIYLLLEPEDIYDGQATTIPYNATGKNPYIKEDGTALPVDKREPFYGAMKECRITLTKGGGQTWALGSKEIRSVLAHEVFHCFTIDLIGIDANIKLPHWLREGSAMWVGEELAGGSSLPDAQRAWNRYLTGTGVKKDGSPISANLFQRDYDAIGLFAHLKNSKLNPWNLIKSALLAGSSGSSTDAFKALTSSAKKDILETWASGLARLPSLGSA